MASKRMKLLFLSCGLAALRKQEFCFLSLKNYLERKLLGRPQQGECDRHSQHSQGRTKRQHQPHRDLYRLKYQKPQRHRSRILYRDQGDAQNPDGDDQSRQKFIHGERLGKGQGAEVRTRAKAKPQGRAKD